MKKGELKALLTTLVVIAVGALVALAASQESVRFNGWPVFAIAIALAYLIQWVAFIPSYLNRTEKFYDLTGGITYLSVTLLSLVLSGNRDARAILLAALVIAWSLRLSLFLFQRVRKAGEDRRFREIKQSFWSFLQTWTLQGLWVTFNLAAALAVITSTRVVPIGAFAVVGFVIWLVGYAIEVVADA